MVWCVQCGEDDDAWADDADDDIGASVVSSGGASAFPLALLGLVLASVRRRRRPVPPVVPDMNFIAEFVQLLQIE